MTATEIIQVTAVALGTPAIILAAIAMVIPPAEEQLMEKEIQEHKQQPESPNQMLLKRKLQVELKRKKQNQQEGKQI